MKKIRAPRRPFLPRFMSLVVHGGVTLATSNASKMKGWKKISVELALASDSSFPAAGSKVAAQSLGRLLPLAGQSGGSDQLPGNHMYNYLIRSKIVINKIKNK